MYITINEVAGPIEEKMETNTELLFLLIKTFLEKYAKLWDEIKYIKTINGGEYNYIECNSTETVEDGKDFMKIKFKSDDNLPLKKILKLC